LFKDILLLYKSENKDKLNFILINILTSFLKFVRSFVFMKFLNFSDLGMITIISTIMSLFGMFQFGLLNGGYRIFSLRKPKEEEDIIADYTIIREKVLKQLPDYFAPEFLNRIDKTIVFNPLDKKVKLTTINTSAMIKHINNLHIFWIQL